MDNIILTDKEKKLIEELRKNKYGTLTLKLVIEREVEIEVVNSEPQKIEWKEIKIKL